MVGGAGSQEKELGDNSADSLLPNEALVLVGSHMAFLSYNQPLQIKLQLYPCWIAGLLYISSSSSSLSVLPFPALFKKRETAATN